MISQRRQGGSGEGRGYARGSFAALTMLAFLTILQAAAPDARAIAAEMRDEWVLKMTTIFAQMRIERIQAEEGVRIVRSNDWAELDCRYEDARGSYAVARAAFVDLMDKFQTDLKLGRDAEYFSLVYPKLMSEALTANKTFLSRVAIYSSSPDASVCSFEGELLHFSIPEEIERISNSLVASFLFTYDYFQFINAKQRVKLLADLDEMAWVPFEQAGLVPLRSEGCCNDGMRPTPPDGM